MHSKCQKYSPTESSKAYDKAVSRKQGVVFDPKQVVEKIRADVTGARKVLLSKDEYIKHYLEVSLSYKHRKKHSLAYRLVTLTSIKSN